MTLKIILLALQLFNRVVTWLERQRWKAEGKREANEQAKALHDQRVAEALAARADADELDGLHDPRNRDNRN